MLTIDLSPLKPGRHELTLEPQPEDIAVDAALFGEIVVRVELEYRTERALARLEVSGVAQLECDRTLKVFAEPVRGEHTLLFLPDSHLQGDGAKGDDDIRPLPLPGEPLDITEAVRDTLMLALPVRKVAPGADEHELDLVFGEQASQSDPRWDALKKLREES